MWWMAITLSPSLVSHWRCEGWEIILVEFGKRQAPTRGMSWTYPLSVGEFAQNDVFQLKRLKLLWGHIFIVISIYFPVPLIYGSGWNCGIALRQCQPILLLQVLTQGMLDANLMPFNTKVAKPRRGAVAMMSSRHHGTHKNIGLSVWKGKQLKWEFPGKRRVHFGLETKQWPMWLHYENFCRLFLSEVWNDLLHLSDWSWILIGFLQAHVLDMAEQADVALSLGGTIAHSQHHPTISNIYCG